MEHWYEFRAHNEQARYGYGPAFAADEYTDHLNRGRDVNHFAAYRLPDEMATEMKLDSRNDTFDIMDELAEIDDASQELAR